MIYLPGRSGLISTGRQFSQEWSQGDPGQGMVGLAPHSHSTAFFVPASLSTDRPSGVIFEPVLCQTEGLASIKLECVGCVELDVREAKP